MGSNGSYLPLAPLAERELSPQVMTAKRIVKFLPMQLAFVGAESGTQGS